MNSHRWLHLSTRPMGAAVAVALIVSLLGAAPSQANALPAGVTLVAYEGFDYPAGSLKDRNGGSGWTTAWLGTNELTVDAQGLTYPGLASTGGTSAWLVNGTLNAANTRSMPLQNSGIVYLQFLSKFSANHGGGTPNIRLFKDNGQNVTAFIGNNNNDNNVNVGNMLVFDGLGTRLDSGKSIVNVLNLTILKFDYSANTSEIWVNPDLATWDYLNPPVPDDSAVNFAPAFDTLQPITRNSGFFDEISVLRVDPPTSTGAPSISGSPEVGSTLTATTGQWSVLPTSATYQWLRCDDAGANCTSIAGATNSTYVTSTADVGSTVRVKVTIASGIGGAEQNSAATGLIHARPVEPLLPLGSPTVTSINAAGSRLTCRAPEFSKPVEAVTFTWAVNGQPTEQRVTAAPFEASIDLPNSVSTPEVVCTVVARGGSATSTSSARLAVEKASPEASASEASEALPAACAPFTVLWSGGGAGLAAASSRALFERAVDSGCARTAVVTAHIPKDAPANLRRSLAMRQFVTGFMLRHSGRQLQIRSVTSSDTGMCAVVRDGCIVVSN